MRLRRLRSNSRIRDIVRETWVRKEDLIYPIFVKEGLKGAEKESIPSMSGEYKLSVDGAVEVAKELVEKGVPGILLFGIPRQKDPEGRAAYDPEGVIPRSVSAIKEELDDRLMVICDICLCEYTTHGHCGPLINGRVDNDSALKALAKASTVCAEAGADIIAPSDMMDGRIGYIRSALDNDGFQERIIMAYAAKFASSLYSPFRDAAESGFNEGPKDRKTYQMDPPNADEAMREVEQDILEGADIVMVKPTLFYLDILRQVKDAYRMPTAAYNVSGEFAMIKKASEAGLVDEEAVVLELLTSIKRAGADIIITYFAKDYAEMF